MQLDLGLTDTPISTVTPTESLSRSASAKRDSHRQVTIGDSHERIYQALLQCSDGLTREEIAQRTGMKLSTVCARVNEMLNASVTKIYIGSERRNKCSVVFARS